jgi:RNA polymerase sigma factor (sigma-70 family)
MPDPIDADLLANLLDAHGAALELYAAQWSDAPEDCVQEAFIELARQSTVPENPAAWLFRVVRNRAMSMARSRERRRRRESAAAQLRPASQLDEAPLVDAAGLAEALASLEGSRREAVTARIWGQLSFEQIGQVMGVSTSTAHRHYLAGLADLRERLGEPCTSRKNFADGNRSRKSQNRP